jgi:hypothetical protein
MNRSEHRIDCPTLASARAIREKYRDLLADSDDARTTVVHVTSWALDHWVDDMRRIAAEDRDANETYGQARLTRHERSRLDFSETNLFHARSCKAIAVERGVGDWLAYYDPTLTVDEHRDVYRPERQTTRSVQTRFRPQTPLLTD